MQSSKWRRIAWILIVLALPAVIIHLYYAKLFACPSCFQFLDNGDGLKNYYTIAWYVIHDTGWHFTGMNYPYGEHIIYTDNQPLIAMILGWVHRNITPLDRHIIGIVNMLLILSLYIGVLVTYKLLRRWQVGRWWALASALCICLLSPQILRFGGHYALGYIVLIPLLLLLLDLLVRGPGKTWIWASCIGMLIFCSSLIHMYFLFLHAITAGAFLLFWFWYHRKSERRARNRIGLSLLAAIMLPGILLLAIRKYTDPVTDRPLEPWGIEYHCLDAQSTFLNFSDPFDKAWTAWLNEPKPIIEKVTYVGLVGLLMLPALLIFLVRKRDDDPLTPTVKAFLAAAAVAWFMGAGVFYEIGLKGVWEAIPVLKQFRGLGRFGIPFYYIYTLCTSFLLWKLLLRLKEHGLARVGHYVLTAAFCVWAFEVHVYMREQTKPIYHPNISLSDSREDYVPQLTAAGYKPDDFQAILQLPLVAIGNETFGVTRGFWAYRIAVHMSWETGLPMVNYVMSRTSTAQGADIIQLLSSPYYPKKRAALFNDKPLLLIVEEDEILPVERKWLERATKIGSVPPTSMYALPVSVFRDVTDPLGGDTITASTCNGIFEGFDGHPCDTTMSGTGALPITTQGQLIWTFTDTASVARDWHLSFWTYVDNFRGAVAVPRIMETDPQGAVSQYSAYNRENIPWSEAYEQWFEINVPLSTKGKGYTYQLFIDNTGSVIDNLLLRPVRDTCVIVQDNMILFNNLPVPKR
jgi:hypothetical protein